MCSKEGGPWSVTWVSPLREDRNIKGHHNYKATKAYKDITKILAVR